MQAARGEALTGNTPPVAGLRLIAVGLGVLGLALDQLSKEAVLSTLQPARPVEVLGNLVRFTLIRNPGAAFGLGSGSTLALSIFAVLALVAALVVALPRVRRMSHALVLGLLLAGISGNLHDRLLREPGPLYGHVIDFVQLPYFAIFNLADVFITSAAILVLILGLRHQPENEQAGQQVER